MTRRTSRHAREGKKVDVTSTKFASPTDVALAQAQRYCIMGDDSGHEYFIKVGEEQLFNDWVESTEAYEQVGYEGPDFDENRIDGTFTFTDPRCE